VLIEWRSHAGCGFNHVFALTLALDFLSDGDYECSGNVFRRGAELEVGILLTYR